jgi:hypothetical protein
MNGETATKLVLALVLATVILTFAAFDTFAQCAMCKSTASNLDAISARQLNLSTLILLFPPVAIFGLILRIAYKHRNAPDDEE